MSAHSIAPHTRPTSAPEQTPAGEFGRLIAEFRQRRGLSQGQLAHAARLSRTYVYHLESGQRRAPSARVARALLRALELHGEDRRRLAAAFTRLTSQPLEEEPEGLELFDQRELAALLVHNTAFPAHSLDRLWNLAAWNAPSVELFEIDAKTLETHSHNLLAVVFDPAYRAHFRPWEGLARRLVADFKHVTRSLTYLPEYRELWRSLRALPDFKRIADSSDAGMTTAPSFVFQMRHSRLGPLTLRTTATVFSGASDYSIVTYLPGDQQTLTVFAANGWQAGDGAAE
ncbi:MAG TPA: helix-turn-helix domain-containing protein [Ktedonobacterales bacterium]|nr:helix-turn-helix domain-containing protein [Ktedonobacterales bacterium]